MNNADLMVKMLAEAGVTRGFGIPSGNVLPFIEAMRAGGIDFVLTAHEGSAAFAADVTGRMTGVPGLCIATLGPGATNLTTGVGSAWLDRSPLIAITCNVPTSQLGRRVQMAIDHHALFAPITKASLAARFDNVAEVTAAAIRIAMTEPRGPVHIDLPEDVSVAPASDRSTPTTAPAAPRLADDAEITRAAAIIAGARRPVAVLGNSATRMAHPERLRAFVEQHGLPVATTTMAKGLIDDDHPLAIGCIERARRQEQRRFIQQCDLVIGLGYDTVEVEYEAWIGDRPLLAIDIEAPDLAPSVTLAGTVIGDLDDSLDRLSRRPAPGNDWQEGEIVRHKAAFQAALRPVGRGLTPHAVIDACRAALPRGGIGSFDVGAHTHQIASQWAAHEPRTFLATNGWSSMGFGLPGAIAAKLAAPDRPVLCLIGDGCFQMTCGELATARRAGITLPVVVIDDRWLSLIRVKQARRGLAPYGSWLGPAVEGRRTPPSHYFGVPAVGVRTARGLRDALAAAFLADGPTVIEAAVDPAQYMDTVFD